MEGKREKTQELEAHLKTGRSYRESGQIQLEIESFQKALKLAEELKDRKQLTKANIELGKAYRLNNQFQTAFEYYEKALQIAKEEENKQDETNAYLGLGHAYREHNQFLTAIEYYEKALQIAKVEGNKQQETNAYLVLGIAYRMHNRFQTAIEHNAKAWKIAKERGDKQQEAKGYFGLAMGNAFRLKNLSQAHEYYEQALKIAKERGYKHLENNAKYAIEELSRITDAVDENNDNTQTSNTSDGAQMQDDQHKTQHENMDHIHIENESIRSERKIAAEQILILARSYQSEGKNEDAIKSYERAVQIADEIDDNDIRVKACQHLGNVFTTMSEYKKAIEYYQKAREISPGLTADELEVIAYQWLGYNHLQAGQYQESMQYYDEVRKLASQLEDKKRKVNAYLGLGSVLSNTSEFESSRKYFLKALTVAEQLNDKHLQIEAHANLGHVYYKSCKFDAAVKSYIEVQEISHDLGDRKEEANACLMLSDTFQELKQHEKAIEVCQKALNISKELEDKEVQVNAVQGLGSNYISIGQYEEALQYSKILVELTDDPNYPGPKQALIQKQLGMCYAYLERFEEGLACFEKALEMVRGYSEIVLEGIINEWCGYCCRFIADQHQEAITFYEKAKEIAKQVGGKYEEYLSNQAIGNILSDTRNYEKAKEYYQEAMEIAVKLGNKHCEGTSCLNLATVCSKDCDYEMAIKWYEKVLDIFATELNDHLLLEKALTGLGIACFNLGDTEKAIESIQEAKKFAEREIDTGPHDVETTHGHKYSTDPTAPSSPVADSNEVHSTHAQENSPAGEKASLLQARGANKEEKSENVVSFQESEAVLTEERVDALIEAACNPSRTERITSGDLVRIEKYIEIAASYVYTRQISTKEPFTEKVRKAMTENVKTSAYTSLLGQNDHKPRAGSDGKFLNGDQQIFNFAKDEVYKNSSTKKPAILNQILASSLGSVGQIVCGSVQGTCFLVTDELVLTNYHVYRAMEAERNRFQDPNLSITVLFDYFRPGQTENVVLVEVDEAVESGKKLENPYLDYKFFRLKQNEGLRDRVLLGPIVRNWQLSDGRVVILGHPEGQEMQDEVCVVVGYRAMQDTIRERHKQFNGVHMTNADLLRETEDYQGCLSYDTTFFCGASGSPIFEMNGNIVAMHTQGYSLNMEEEYIHNQSEHFPNLEQENTSIQEQEDVPNQEQENISRQRKSGKYSLMEFGVQFISICRDMRQWHGENVVKKIFPNYKLKPGELEPIDET